MKLFSEQNGNSERSAIIREVKVEDLKNGMILTEDVINLKGVVLVRSGIEINAALLLRLQNIAKQQSGIQEPIRVKI